MKNDFSLLDNPVEAPSRSAPRTSTQLRTAGPTESDYYSEERHGPHEYFELGNFELESGITLPNARLAWKTHGTLNPAKDNAILFPHMWSGTPKAMEIFIPNSRFRVVRSLWAHFAMFCMTPSEREQIDACIGDLLNESA